MGFLTVCDRKGWAARQPALPLSREEASAVLLRRLLAGDGSCTQKLKREVVEHDVFEFVGAVHCGESH